MAASDDEEVVHALHGNALSQPSGIARRHPQRGHRIGGWSSPASQSAEHLPRSFPRRAGRVPAPDENLVTRDRTRQNAQAGLRGASRCWG